MHHYITKIFFINCLLLQGLHGMNMDTSEDRASATHPLIKKLGSCMTSWYGQHGVDACAVGGDGGSPLHELIFCTNTIEPKKRAGRAQELIEVGVSLDPKAHDTTWGTLTFVQKLKVKIRQERDSDRPDVQDIQNDTQLLEAVQKAVMNRNTRAFSEVHRFLSKDTAGIVLSYYVDQEKFDQSDAEIATLARHVTMRQRRNAAERGLWDRWIP